MALRDRCRNARVLGLPVSQLLNIDRLERDAVEVGASGVDVQADLETLGVVLRCLRIAQGRGRVDVGSASYAFPIGHRATRRAGSLELVEARPGSPIAMVIATHDDNGLLAVREVPETGQRFSARVHVENQVRKQALLLVCLRDRHLVQIDPVRFHIARGVAVELVVRPDRCEPVAFLRGPGGIALARVDDRGCQVVGECRRFAAARAEQRDRRVVRGHGCGAVQRGQTRCAVQVVEVGRAMELDGLVDDAVAGPCRCVDEQIAV